MSEQPYNRFTQEEFERVNKFNKEVREDFLLSLKGTKTAQTIRVYTNDTKIILITILRILDNKKIIELKKKDLIRMRVYFSETLNMSNARVNAIYSALRMLMLFVEDDDSYSEDLDTQFISCGSKVSGLPKVPVRTDETAFFIPYDTIIKIRKSLEESGDTQGALLFSFLYDSACRRGEIVQVEKKNLLTSNFSNIVIGKGRKRFRLMYGDETKRLIEKWLSERGEDNCEMLFIKKNGDQIIPLSSDDVYTFFINKIRPLASEIEGKPINCFVHTLRHSRIQNLLDGSDTSIVDENGLPKKLSLEQLKILAHHQSSSTTEGYCKQVNGDDILADIFGFDMYKD